MKKYQVVIFKVVFILVGFVSAYALQTKNISDANKRVASISQSADSVKTENLLLKSTLVGYRLSCVKSERF